MKNNSRRLRLKSPSSISSWKETALVALLLIYSGNPAPTRIFSPDIQLSCIALLFAFLLLRQKKPFLTIDFVVISLLFAEILIVQCLDFSFYPIVTILGFFIRLFIGYSALQLVKDFPRVYVRTMVGFALLSFIFYIPILLLSLAGISLEGPFKHLATLLGTDSVSRSPLFLYTFISDFPPRNAGMFWEPGAFQGYLILALIFLAFIKPSWPKKQYRRSFLILLSAVLSTMSTTGYIALPITLLLHYDWRTSNRGQGLARFLVGVFLVCPLLVAGSIYLFNKVPFLGEKIEGQYLEAEQQHEQWYTSRIGSVLFDWEYIKRRPLTGWGLHSRTRFAMDEAVEGKEGMGNGFTDFIAKFGVLGFMVWFVAVSMGLRSLCRGNWVQVLLISSIILVLLQGETFMNYPFFLGLAFLRSEPLSRKLFPQSISAFQFKNKFCLSGSSNARLSNDEGI